MEFLEYNWCCLNTGFLLDRYVSVAPRSVLAVRRCVSTAGDL